jgi:hypothetical protein
MHISARGLNLLLMLVNGAVIWWIVRQTPFEQQGIVSFALVFLSVTGWACTWIILNSDREGVFRKMKPPKPPKE